MNVVCVILAGGNREAVIAGAIESVIDCVDRFVLIDTGTSQKAIEVARGILGDRRIVFRHAGEFDCATVRNFGLQCAESIGADWALMLDTDERLHAEPGIVRRMLSEVADNHVLIDDSTHTYKKSKFFRFPLDGHWSGMVHEAYVGTTMPCVARDITFSELPKTLEEQAQRLVWIEAQCRKAIESDPGQARWRYYLADSLAGLGSRHDEAAEEFLQAAKLSDWPEEADWSCYRAAQCRFDQGRYQDAIDICNDSGMRIPELAWYAAICAASAGKLHETVDLIKKAIALAEKQRERERAGFVNRVAWYEGPYEVLALVHEAIGDKEKLQLTLEKIEELRAQRLALAA